MTIDWAGFTPGTSLAGGALIGLAACSLILLGGRVAGISGIAGGLLRPRRGDIAWRAAFIAGLMTAPWIYGSVAALPVSRVDADAPVLVLAGLLVGVGTRYGAGCTSGHGVCGLSRLSVRSLAATMVFMAAGFATVFAVRHVVGG